MIHTMHIIYVHYAFLNSNTNVYVHFYFEPFTKHPYASRATREVIVWRRTGNVGVALTLNSKGARIIFNAAEENDGSSLEESAKSLEIHWMPRAISGGSEGG